MQTPTMRLTMPHGQPAPQDRYLLTTFLDTLTIPHTYDSDKGYLLFPSDGHGQTLELAMDLNNADQAFATLTRIEEWQNPQRDAIGRFPFSASEFAADFRCHVDAQMEEFATIVGEAARKAGGEWRRQPVWPGDASFAVCLTHDIDWTRKWSARHLLGHIARDGLQGVLGPRRTSGWRRMNRDLQSALRRENPYWNLGEIAAREREFGFNSTFFVLAGRWHKRDGDYSVSEPKILDLLEGLRSQGSEIALHGSYLSFAQPELLAQELRRLRSAVGEVCGVRQHYLRFDVQSTLKTHEELGFKYDTTLGFAEHEGYRCGFSYPYYPYSFEEERPFNVLEIPLTIMDTTLHHYRRLNSEQAWRAVRHQLEYVKRSGGCCTLLWHNNYFDEGDYPGYGELYWRALAWIAENGGWGASAGEINAWWRSRARSRERAHTS